MEKKSSQFVDLDTRTIKTLEDQAKKKGINLETHMQDILVETANDFDLSDAYKARMDSYLERKKKGETLYISEEEFSRRTGI